MALQKDASISGVTVSNAYHRVENVSLSGKSSGVAYVSVYGTQPSDGVLYSMSYGFPYELSSSNNIIQQIYEHLKTLPEFTGATDV